MLTVFVILGLIVIGIVALFIIALVAHKLGFVDDSTFARCSNISTIVGVPLGVIAVIIAIAGFFRDKPAPPPPPSPSPTPIVQTSPRPELSPSVAPFRNQTPTASATPTLYVTPQEQQEAVAETRPRTSSEAPAPTSSAKTRYDRGDIGARKENGYYEITLENAKTSSTCTNGFARASNNEKLINVTFSLRAAHLQVPSIPSGRDVDAYYLEDGEGRRYQMSCGDGRYFNVSLNSFEGKPNPKTLTVSFVIPITAQGLRFRFTPPAGDAMVLTLPNPL